MVMEKNVVDLGLKRKEGEGGKRDWVAKGDDKESRVGLRMAFTRYIYLMLRRDGFL